MHPSGRLAMKPEEFRLLREYVSDTIGIVIDETRESQLALRLRPRLEELRFSSYGEYYAHLKFSPHSSEEQRRLVSLITNNETYFFREEAQLQVFAGQVLPRLMEEKRRRGERRLRIVSAGCSSGEEVYTLAMLLLETGSFFQDWDIRITGVDIDPDMIRKAEEGFYAGRAFQTTPEEYLGRYFRKQGDGHVVKDFVRGITSFIQGNILHLQEYLGEKTADVIFCRNVIIYFSDETIRKVMDGFAATLVDSGYLFLGHSESLSRITSRYLPQRYPGAIIYLKKDGGLPCPAIR